MKATIRVATIRRQRAGRTVFTGKVVDAHGQVVDARSFVVVTATRKILCNVVEQGQWWTVSGAGSSREIEVDGFRMTEHSICADVAKLERLSGEHLVSYLAHSSIFAGVGMVKARRLWDALGEDLYRVMDDGDIETLSKFVTREVAANATAKWASMGNSSALKWLQDMGLEVSLGRKVLQFHGVATPQKITEDPYRLLSFCASWNKVDAIARSTFGVQADDPRRIQGAVEEACYAAFADGHTSLLSVHLQARIWKLLGQDSWPIVHAALNQGLSNGAFVVGPHGVQPLGAAAMEHVVARFISEHALNHRPEVTDAELLKLMDDFEKSGAIVLNTEQRRAIELANRHPIGLITGGAGVGKTTVLKAIYGLYDKSHTQIVQIALAGRAAKRMQEATGRSASTVAAFIRGTKPGDLVQPTVVVIDEASMLDIVSMAAICERLSSTTRLLLIGDPHQLMPVGPGLVLHALVSVSDLPQVELTVVKRHGGAILSAAQMLRAGIWPVLPGDIEEPISFLTCSTREKEMAETVVDLYGLDPEHTQVLVSKRHGAGGAALINSLAQERFSAMNPPVLNGALESTGFHVGDPVLCNRNLWDHGLQNGSMGVVSRVESIPIEQVDEVGRSNGLALAWVVWDDGISRPLMDEMLDDITLGYAVTVHKAQGSQWKRVIVPIVANRMLDRALLYTAVTRAQSQVVMLGDVEAARRAVESLPRSGSRNVALDLTLRRMCEHSRSSRCTSATSL